MHEETKAELSLQLAHDWNSPLSLRIWVHDAQSLYFSRQRRPHFEKSLMGCTLWLCVHFTTRNSFGTATSNHGNVMKKLDFEETMRGKRKEGKNQKCELIKSDSDSRCKVFQRGIGESAVREKFCCIFVASLLCEFP